VSRISAMIFAAVSLLFTVASRSEAQTAVVRINAGGSAVSPFVADTDYNTGNQASSTATITTTGVTNAAPAAVYQSVRWNASFTYMIPGLTANAAYVVRLHFVELTFTGTGQRTFNVAINGTSVLSNFDIFAQVGQNHALEKDFNATANSSGQIVVAFTQGSADNPSVAGLEVWTPPAPPAAPTGLSATAGSAQATLSWTASSGATSYNVYRGTTAGGESSTAIAAGITGTSYTNTGLTNGTTYYYKVAAVNAGGTSGMSNEASATPSGVGTPNTAVIQINAGGAAVSPFIADTDYNTGNQASSSATIATTGVTNAAPAAVYQSVRWNASFTYTIPGLTANAAYVVRLHFVELTFTGAGQRTFNVAINGTSVLSNFDIFAQVGQNHALEKEFNATANSSGQIVVAFTQGGADNPAVAGLEVWTPPGAPAAPTGLSATAGSAQATLNWTASSGATSYNVYRGTTAGGESSTAIATGITGTSYTNTGLTNGTTYYYKVAAVNAGGTSGLSNEASATPASVVTPNTAVIQINAGGTAVSPFIADTDFDLGSQASSSATITTTGVNHAAPAAVYQSVRWNASFTYTIPGLTAGASYVVRLHFVELTWTSAGSRKFNVAINGTSVLSAFDVYAAAGGQNIAVEREFLATANGSGQVVVAFTQGGADKPDLAGIEVWTPPTIPAAPTGLTATGGNAQVSLTWTASSGATSYNVYRGTSSGGESATAIATGVATTNLTDTTAANGTTYYYKVAAVNIAGTSAQSNEASATPTLPPPLAPTGLTAAPGNAQVSLSWSASSGAASYKVYRGTTAGGESATAIATGVTSAFYTDTGLTNGTTYYYKVAAVNSAGTSPQSGEASATPAVVTSQAAEAETAFSSGGPSVATSLGSYSGTGYVTGFTVTGARTLFTTNVAAATTSSIGIRYQNTSGSAQSLSLYVNNERIGQVSLPSGSGWQTATVSAVLHSGLNLIGLQRDSADSASSVALDKIDVSGASPLATRGATTPYTTYEAEDSSVASTNGSVLATNRTYLTLASESSGRSAVQLTQTGHYVQFTLRAAANAMVIRYSIPDSADGTGLNSTLSLYANGTKVQTLAVSSKYAWVYGAYPYDNNPGDGSAHHFYSESGFLIGNWPAGTVLKLQKDSGDTAANYTIDLVDFEQVEAAATMPSGYISIEAYGATANDGTDDTTAINNAIAAAATGNKKVWIPAGTYNINARINVANVQIRGAGPWYSILQGANGKGGVFATGSNVTLSDFTLSGDVTYRNDAGFDSAVEGNFGTGSTIFNLWLRRAKVGMWIDSGTNGLYVGGVRIRDMFADGVNLHANVQNTRIDQSSIRNTGDDALAMWSDGSAVTNCAFTFNTSQLPMLANTAGIYGGSGNSITDNLMSDTVTACAGIAVSTRFNPVALSGTTTVARNTLTRTGGWEPNWATQLGAVWIYTDTLDITTPVIVKDTSIIDTTYQAVLISYGKTVSGLLLDHLTIQTAGTYGIQVNNESGSATVQNTSITGAASGAISNPGTTFTLTLGSGNTGF
jgi:fibronectin type 3 domain-containing protein